MFYCRPLPSKVPIYQSETLFILWSSLSYVRRNPNSICIKIKYQWTENLCFFVEKVGTCKLLLLLLLLRLWHHLSIQNFQVKRNRVTETCRAEQRKCHLCTYLDMWFVKNVFELSKGLHRFRNNPAQYTHNVRHRMLIYIYLSNLTEWNKKRQGYSINIIVNTRTCNWICQLCCFNGDKVS
jgi:hypothetical protein